MKVHQVRNTILALAGLAALCVYILACTSFSPDDTKVLYPAFDNGNGAIGMAVYDREERRSEMLFLPVWYGPGQSNAVAPKIMRSHWLADGRHILVAFGGGEGNDDNSLDLALVPWGEHAPVKLFHVPNLKDADEVLMRPLCVVKNQVFLGAGPEVIRLDLKTGLLVRHSLGSDKTDAILYPSPNGEGVFYVEERKSPEEGTEIGRLDPEDFTQAPLLVITNQFSGQSFAGYDPRGKQAAFLGTDGGTNRLVVIRPGKPVFTRTIGTPDEEWAFCSLGFSLKGDSVWASYAKGAPGTNVVAYGLAEIPLNQEAIRETTLIREARSEDRDKNNSFFQAALSHDGKTIAVASTYLAVDAKEFDAADCALFLVDVSGPERKVTKVPVPMPVQRTPVKSK